jgi:hypothetical protein
MDETQQSADDDAGGRDPLISRVSPSPACRAKRKLAPARGDRDRTRASSPRRSAELTGVAPAALDEERVQWTAM